MARPLHVALLTATALCLAFAAGPQDPVRAPDPRLPLPPQDAMPLPPVPDLPRSSVERRDLARAFLPESPLEGVWRLVRMAQPGGDLGRVEGYLSVGRKHLQLHVLHGEPGGGSLFAQSGARQYTVVDGTLVTTALVGHDNLADGKTLRFDTPGRVERRRLEIEGSRLRVYQDERSFMEFLRVE